MKKKMTDTEGKQKIANFKKMQKELEKEWKAGSLDRTEFEKQGRAIMGGIQAVIEELRGGAK